MSQPITREEQYLSAMASGNSTDIKPVTREEVFLAKATGQSVAIPEPITRKEVFLRDIALNGSGGGSVILKPFTLTEGGNYRAVDYGADGFSSVFADVDPAPIWDGDFTIVGTPEEGGDDDESMVGTWMFNDVLDLPTQALEVTFRAADNGIYEIIEDAGDSLHYSLSLDDYTYSVYDKGIWIESFRTINILKEPSAEAAEWIRANAKKQGVPKAYHLSSADELPTDAVYGSLAEVDDSDSIEGEWEFPQYGSQLNFSALNLPNSSYSNVSFSSYESNMMSETNDYWEITTDEEGNVQIAGSDYGLFYDDNEGGVLEDYSYLAVYTDVREIQTITNSEQIEAFTKEDFKTFFDTNFKRISGGHTLYSRENGEWVKKGEI
jgi:hypothetical protein